MSDQATVKKKGLHPVAWVGIGCGAILLIGIIAAVSLGVWGYGKAKDAYLEVRDNPEKFGAEMVIKGNPELNYVETDEVAGTVTFTDQDGKTHTLSYEDISEGKLTMETDGEAHTVEMSEGGVSVTGEDGTSMQLGGAAGLEKVPGWFEMPEGLSGGRSLMHMEQEGKASGRAMAESELDPAALGEAFAESLTAAGFSQKNRVEAGPRIMYHFEKEEGQQSVNVTIAPQGGKTTAIISYREK